MIIWSKSILFKHVNMWDSRGLYCWFSQFFQFARISSIIIKLQFKAFFYEHPHKIKIIYYLGWILIKFFRGTLGHLSLLIFFFTISPDKHNLSQSDKISDLKLFFRSFWNDFNMNKKKCKVLKVSQPLYLQFSFLYILISKDFPFFFQ